MENRCICCGDIIPEGRQVCPNCEHKAKEPRMCPFCGSAKLKLDSKKVNSPRYIAPGKWEDGHTGSVRCQRCHARGPTATVWVPRHTLCGILDQIKDAAFAAWNRRGNDG